MTFDLMPLMGSLMAKQALEEVVSCNEHTRQYGLRLSESEARELIAVRQVALGAAGRVEFRGGSVKKILLTFCDSPYLTQETYAETMAELVDLFYQCKNETLDMVGDDALIDTMKRLYCDSQGFLELLYTRLEQFARHVRMGNNSNSMERIEQGDDDEDQTLG